MRAGLACVHFRWWRAPSAYVRCDRVARSLSFTPHAPLLTSVEYHVQLDASKFGAACGCNYITGDWATSTSFSTAAPTDLALVLVRPRVRSVAPAVRLSFSGQSYANLVSASADALGCEAGDVSGLKLMVSAVIDHP